MKIELVCFSELAKSDGCDYRSTTPYDLTEGLTVADLMQQAGIARDDVKIAFVNRRPASIETRLSDGDRVGLAPAVGGM